MQKEAVLHIPLSNYAHGIDEEHVVFRLRTARGDMRECLFFYGDRAYGKNPVVFSSRPMKLAGSDELFDYYELELHTPYTRICYYFQLNDGKETLLYYSSIFTKEMPAERSEFFQLPFNHKADIARIPDWVDSAVIYNIFPDSFATGRRFISKQGITANLGDIATQSRNGGTIRGITENIDYIEELGINCIYINPIFAAGEYHKYDLVDYFRIDPCFGTNADFKTLVDQCHKRNIKIIIDGVFNHCGWNFFAFDDVVRNGEASRYKDWFYHLEFPVIRPDNPEDVPGYTCFAYERKMPKMNTANREVREYFLKVCRYWLEEFHIDGWRLDVANEVDYAFWREFRNTAKSVNPDCFLIGEVWESAQSWLKGDMFDSTMNYDFRKNCRDFFALGKLDAAGFDGRVTEMRMRYNKNITPGQLNLLDSHDVPRFLSLCGGDMAKFKLAAVFQMTFIGIPSVFYGDEKCIQGMLEHEYRHPMVWEQQEDETISELYRKLISFRRSSNALHCGEYETVRAEPGTGLYMFRRYTGSEQVTVALNVSGETVDIASEPDLTSAEIVLAEGFDDGSRLQPRGFALFRTARKA
ncbi:glycoside hydrolase family 13 protein [Ruminiclostridium cellobioparum]|jgi:cyclomaltodextrinase|uniref:glycoside hydrolase family 13 protein n=1 Tax=Ruminiclostridium cellobioparum TaxID=29355 RepID=UPI00047F26F1|nr:glycoside hydrolase family 13 protein [Ruminiclostridium cellobioparum]